MTATTTGEQALNEAAIQTYQEHRRELESDTVSFTPQAIDVMVLKAAIAAGHQPDEIEQEALRNDEERVAALAKAGKTGAPGSGTSITEAAKKAKAKADRERAAERKAEREAAKAASGKAAQRSKGKMSFQAAAEKVLRDASGPMHVKDITETVLKKKMAQTSGKTPVATMAAVILRNAGKGGTFVKTDPGTFDVRELNPRGAKARPKK